jgi:3-mercaptopropionate dioxygenase
MAAIPTSELEFEEQRFQSALTRFATEVEELRRNHGNVPRVLASHVADRLAWLVRDRSWLSAQYQLPSDTGYRQHVLHVAPDGGFSVVALVWRPGQRTPIHDHVAWCVVGVYEGTEHEVRYQLCEDDRGRFLTRTSARESRPGMTTALVPPDEDIHEVINGGDGLAVSIHVYGANIAELGTSIWHRFEELPVRPSGNGASVLSWRTAR